MSLFLGELRGIHTIIVMVIVGRPNYNRYIVQTANLRLFRNVLVGEFERVSGIECDEVGAHIVDRLCRLEPDGIDLVEEVVAVGHVAGHDGDVGRRAAPAVGIRVGHPGQEEAARGSGRCPWCTGTCCCGLPVCACRCCYAGCSPASGAELALSHGGSGNTLAAARSGRC